MMDNCAKKALEASITKWEVLTEATDPYTFKLGITDCPLCLEFVDLWSTRPCFGCPCFGCPVYKKTGQPFCRNTPYERAYKAHTNWAFAVNLNNSLQNDLQAEFQAAAREEVEFLKSLREPEQEPIT